MNNQVTIVENSTTGAVVTMRTITDRKSGETREVGSIMVQSKSLTGLSSLGRVQTRTAFLTLEQDALEVQQSGSTFKVHMDANSLGYNLSPDDEIVAWGKFNS